MVSVPLVVFELLCALGARADIAVEDMSTASEAAAAASILSAFLPPYKAGIVVIGHAPWTGDLLRVLPEGTPRVVLDNDVMYDKSDRLVVAVQQSHHVLLVVVDAFGDLAKIRTLPLIRRALFWMRVARLPLEVVQDETLRLHMSRTRRCVDETALALADPKGAVHLYTRNERTRCTDNAWSFIFADRWSTEEQRWLRAAPLFMRFCDKWSPPPGTAAAGPLNLMTLRGNETKGLALFADDIARYSLTPRKIINTQYWVTEPKLVHTVFDVMYARISNCSLDGTILGYGIPPSCPLELSALFSQRLSSIVVVVPAGLGPAISPLAAVALEFSPAVWLCTALAALVTAATLAWALRRDRGDALLLVLAPLLAQAPPPPPAASPALRPLLGAWLLVCVVLVAAYQGLLLGMLTAARPRGEIDSLQALDESGLPVHSDFDVFHTIADSLPESLRNRIEIYESPELNLSELYEKVALARDRAFIIFSDPLTEKRLELWSVHDKTVHTFQIEPGQPRVTAIWQKGSELGSIISKFAGRERQAGIIALVQRMDDFVRLMGRKKCSGSTEACFRQLTLAMMRPAFLFLAAGLALATFVFVFVEGLVGVIFTSQRNFL
ncbi:Ionotropic receptor 93a [Frankliniella fusca]|uniref:Ionotropic receptor 93a n=1 Tax=Frankliniella fusca TaxID=407009 RepID=A0AAE1H6N6_9NEOP|nr:Ionotropic receptor 93a [Frankliniella fusca]